MRLLFVVALLLVGCPRPQINPPNTNPVNPPDVEEREKGLTVSLRSMVLRQNEEERPMVEGETLHVGDRVFFVVRANQPVYLYVVLFGPDGKATVMFPPDSVSDGTVAARCPTRIPEKGAYFLQQPAGPEDVRVIASLEPLGKVDRRLCEQLQLPCQTTASGPAPPRQCPVKEVAQDARSIFSSVKMATAGERGVVSVRMGFIYDQGNP